MRVLLDTHTLYWFIEGDPQLSRSNPGPRSQHGASPFPDAPLPGQPFGRPRLEQPLSDILRSHMQELAYIGRDVLAVGVELLD